MFEVNQPVQILIDLGKRRVWLAGMVAEKRTPLCGHYGKPLQQGGFLEVDCLSCWFSGNQPRYEVSVEYNGKSYLARNVPPGNLRLAT